MEATIAELVKGTGPDHTSHGAFVRVGEAQNAVAIVKNLASAGADDDDLRICVIQH